MRTLLGLGIVLAVAFGAHAADEKKIDAMKLIGKWEPVKPKKDEELVMEFTKDGKLIVTGSMGEKALKIEGTYKLEGDKLSFVLKFMGDEIKQTVTITKLTDDEMEGTDPANKTEAFKKVKPK